MPMKESYRATLLSKLHQDVETQQAVIQETLLTSNVEIKVVNIVDKIDIKR